MVFIFLTNPETRAVHTLTAPCDNVVPHPICLNIIFIKNCKAFPQFWGNQHMIRWSPWTLYTFVCGQWIGCSLTVLWEEGGLPMLLGMISSSPVSVQLTHSSAASNSLFTSHCALWISLSFLHYLETGSH